MVLLAIIALAAFDPIGRMMGDRAEEIPPGTALLCPRTGPDVSPTNDQTLIAEARDEHGVVVATGVAGRGGDSLCLRVASGATYDVRAWLAPCCDVPVEVPLWACVLRTAAPDRGSVILVFPNEASRAGSDGCLHA